MLHGLFTTYIHIMWHIYVYTVNEWIGTVYLVMQLYEKSECQLGTSVIILHTRKKQISSETWACPENIGLQTLSTQCLCMQLLYHRLHVCKPKSVLFYLWRHKIWLHFFACFLSQMMNLTKTKSELQYRSWTTTSSDQIIISNYITTFSSNRANLLLYFRKWTHFCFPLHTNYFQPYCANALSNIWHLIWQRRNVHILHSLVGFVGPKSYNTAWWLRKEQVDNRVLSGLAIKYC